MQSSETESNCLGTEELRWKWGETVNGCDIVIYKKYICGRSNDQNKHLIYFGLLPQFLTYSSQNPWNLLSVESNEGVLVMLMS